MSFDYNNQNQSLLSFFFLFFFYYSCFTTTGKKTIKNTRVFVAIYKLFKPLIPLEDNVVLVNNCLTLISHVALVCFITTDGQGNHCLS